MASIAKSKMKLEIKKKLMINMRWNPYFARIDLVKSADQDVGFFYCIEDVTGSKEKAPIPPSQALELANIVDRYSRKRFLVVTRIINP